MGAQGRNQPCGVWAGEPEYGGALGSAGLDPGCHPLVPSLSQGDLQWGPERAIHRSKAGVKLGVKWLFST